MGTFFPLYKTQSGGPSPPPRVLDGGVTGNSPISFPFCAGSSRSTGRQDSLGSDEEPCVGHAKQEVCLALAEGWGPGLGGSPPGGPALGWVDVLKRSVRFELGARHGNCRQRNVIAQ